MRGPILHIYPAGRPHDEVVIVGDRNALTLLQRAIGRALDHGEAGSGNLYAADGEGFEVLIVEAKPERLATAPVHYAEAGPPEGVGGFGFPNWLRAACAHAQEKGNGR